MKNILIISISIIVILSIIFIGFSLTGKAANKLNNPIIQDLYPNETKFVSKIIDGDTVTIEGESYRLLGFDSDERGEKCYKPASKRMTELVLNKEVTLIREGQDKDQYKRYLRYIFVNNTNVGLEMIKEGLAVARFYDNTLYKEEFIEAEKIARENKVGCKWS